MPLLGSDFPLPLTEPFTRQMALSAGLNDRRLARLTQQGLLRRLVKGVYVAAQARDSREQRIEALKLVVPPGVVITDTTANWVHVGDQALGPNEHTYLTEIHAFHTHRGCRLRNRLVDSGERAMRPRDVMEVNGLRIVTPLRATVDSGRLLSRDHAFATLDLMLRLGGVDKERLLAEVERFKGYRGVRQLRALAPLADPRSESYGESVLRLRWLDEPGLPPPELQIPVTNPYGGTWWLDLGVEELGFAAEYDGEAWHDGDASERDEWRRTTISEMHDFRFEIFRKRHVFGPDQDAGRRLRDGIVAARKSRGEFRPGS